MVDGWTPVVSTADLAYMRFHGSARGKYSGRYTKGELKAAAVRLRALPAKARDIYCYFNNDLGGHAISNAMTLRRILIDAGEYVV
jgi:uncharacterized protein YecE (DUF72 family)